MSSLALKSQIMFWQSKGLSDKDIAQKLAIHCSTVCIYRERVRGFNSKQIADWCFNYFYKEGGEQ